MDKTAKQKLNEKLARWAGFSQRDYEVPSEIGGVAIMSQGWLSPQGEKLWGKLPDFTDSLDSCFEWLVAKLKKSFDVSLIEFHYLEAIKVIECQLKGGRNLFTTPVWISDGSDDAEAATALCLAIEKLIDAEK